MASETRYDTMREFLERHIDEEWTMLGGDFAGQRRTAKGLLSERQEVGLMDENGKGTKIDALGLPVAERDGLVYYPQGTRIFGYLLPFDAPIMSKRFLR